MRRLPSFDELPDGSSWGLWGDDDVRGCLNLLTPERALRAAECVRSGAVFRLDLPLDLPSPPLFGRPGYRHEVTDLENDAGHDETLSDWNTQSSSQWDGFRHIRHPVRGFYNGVADDDHGIDRWGPIVARGVLADVARTREIQPGEPDPIEPDELLASLRCDVEPGDVLLIRTGWTSWYRSLSPAERQAQALNHANCGLRPGPRMWSALWDLHIAAVAADNPSLEVWPPAALATAEVIDAVRDDPTRLDEVFMHYRLLPLLGLPIGEMWDLDELADACAADGVYDFMLTSAPLNLPRGVASPPNAIAIR